MCPKQPRQQVKSKTMGSHYLSHLEIYTGLGAGLAVDEEESPDTPYDGVQPRARDTDILIWTPRRNQDKMFLF